MTKLDPFIHMDQMGEVEYAPGEPKGTPWHPHRGFETVTYMIDGTFEHSDSNGGGGVITNGDTQWMTAGAGILHIEKPPEALVVSRRPVPRHPAVGEPAGRAEVVAAALPGHPRSARSACWPPPTGERSSASSPASSGATPAPGTTYTPMTFVHATLSPEAELVLPWRADYNALVYVLAGDGTVGIERIPVESGQLAVLARAIPSGSPPPCARRAAARSSTCSSSAANRSASRSRWAGPFVMNTRDEVMQAFEDYQAGRIGSIPAVHGAPTELTEMAPDKPS